MIRTVGSIDLVTLSARVGDEDLSVVLRDWSTLSRSSRRAIAEMVRSSARVRVANDKIRTDERRTIDGSSAQ